MLKDVSIGAASPVTSRRHLVLLEVFAELLRPIRGVGLGLSELLVEGFALLRPVDDLKVELSGYLGAYNKQNS